MFSFTLCHHNTLKLVSVSALCPGLNMMTGELAPPVVHTPMLTITDLLHVCVLQCLILKFNLSYSCFFFFVVQFLS